MSAYQLYDLLQSLGLKQLLKIKKVHNDILKYGRGFMTSYCMFALNNIGFFDELCKNDSIDLKLYAEANKLDFRLLEAVCDYLYILGFFRKNENRYMFNLTGKELLNFSQGIFDLLYAYAPLFQDLEFLLKKEKKYGIDVFRREKFVAKGSAGITKYLPFPIAKQIIESYGFKHVLDLGCGSGEFLISLCENSDIKGYGIDVSQEAISYAQEIVEEKKMSGVIKLDICSIFDTDRISKKWNEVQVLTCMFVLHEFLYEGEDKVISLLRKIKQNFKDKYLLVCELCKIPIESLRKSPSAIAEHHLFHALSNQRPVMLNEWKKIFGKADYDIIKIKRFDFAEQGYFLLK